MTEEISNAVDNARADWAQKEQQYEAQIRSLTAKCNKYVNSLQSIQGILAITAEQ